MKKQFMVLLLITVISLLGGWFAMRSELQQDGVRTPFLPQVAAGINDVSVVVVGKPTGDVSDVVNLYRDAKGGWHVKELSGYPAHEGKIRALLASMAQAIVIADKTGDPKRHVELGLDKNNAVLLRVLKRDGATFTSMADLLVGRFTEKFNGTYVRYYGKDQSYLISGEVSLGTDPLDWAMNQVLRIPRLSVRSVTVLHQGKPPLQMVREASSKPFHVQGLPSGLQSASQLQLEKLISTLNPISFSDVEMVTQSQKDVPLVSSVIETFRGLRVTLKAFDGLPQPWVELHAEAFHLSNDIPAKERIKAFEESTRMAHNINQANKRWRYQLPLSQMQGAFPGVAQFSAAKPTPLAN